MIKAIETEYKGHRFRSRLEARWAVFFDALGIEWGYEVEGYDLDGLWYLPDFWLPKQELWIEVKYQSPRASAWYVYESGLEIIEKCARLAELSQKRVALLDGQLRESAYRDHRGSQMIPYWVWYGHDPDDAHEWHICRNCGSIDLVYGGKSGRNYCGHEWKDYYRPLTNKIEKAYHLAKSARFEHGESP